MKNEFSDDSKKHFYGFDYLRVISSFAVVVIHVCFTSEILNKWKLTQFAVPCFIMMSIFLLGFKKDKNGFNVIKVLLSRLLPQYIFWTFVYLGLRFLKAKISSEDFPIGFSEIFLGGSAIQLWFLPAILFWQIIMIYLYKFKQIFIDIILCLTFFGVGYFFNINYNLEGEFIFFFTYNLGFIMISKLVFENYEKLSKINLKFYFCILLVLIAILIYQIYLNKNIFQMYFINVLYAIFVFAFFTFGHFKINRVITILSKYSFGIYLSHFLFYQLFYTVLKILKIEITLTITVLNIFITYLFSYLFCVLVSKNKYLKKVI